MPRRQLVIQTATPRHVGDRLGQLLDERFVTHSELARAIGVHESAVSRWVRNETAPQKRRLRQIAEFFDVAPASLIAQADGIPA